MFYDCAGGIIFLRDDERQTGYFFFVGVKLRNLTTCCVKAADYLPPVSRFLFVWNVSGRRQVHPWPSFPFSHQTWTKAYKRAEAYPSKFLSTIPLNQSHQTHIEDYHLQHYILSIQCFSTNPSSLSSLPLPWPLSSPPPQPHRPLAQAISIRAPTRAPTRAPIKTPINPPLKPPLAAQASPRCAVNPLPHSAICRTLSKLRSKALTPL
jgi:hypothetical protein